MTRRALGGDPVEVQVMGYALSLRREEARRVEVQLRA
jgi:Fe2+ transport system protein FeoA